MSFELIYTSAPRGIKAGTRGYCTVAFTEGMPSNYVQLAESLSGYQKPDNTPVSPVAYSHYRFVVGGQRLSVLSRVTTAAYADYTGRCPTIAHHVLVEHASAQPAGNPAVIMTNPSMFITEWHDEPRLIRKVKNLPSPPAASFAARHWEQACGDAGWAGVLAQSAQETNPKPVYIIFNPERLDPLPLLAESLSLLPPDMRWTITFNTFFTSLPHDTTCLWRCCLPDSPALREMRATPGTLCIDLTKPLGRAPGNGPLVKSARTGEAPSWPQRGAMAFTPHPSTPTASATTSRVRAINTPMQRKRAGVKPKAGIPMLNAGHIPAPAGRKEKRIWPIVVASASITLVILFVLGYFLAPKIYQSLLPSDKPTSAEEPETVPAPSSVATVPPTPDPVNKSEQASGQPEHVFVPAKPPEPEPEPVTPALQETTSTGTPPKETPTTPSAPPASSIKPLADMTPQWREFRSAFNQSPIHVPVKDPAYSNHQHVFYFKSGPRQSPKPKTNKTSLEYKILNLNIEISATEVTFKTTSSSVYPFSMCINRKNSGKSDLIIWLQPLKLECSFTPTSSSSGYDISVSHPALKDCLFGPYLETDNQPWQTNCRIRFKNSTREPKEIPVEITRDGGKGNTWKISLQIDKKKIKDSMLDEIKTERESWTNHKDNQEYIRYVVNKYQKRANTPDFPGKNDITDCLMNLAKKIQEDKEKDLQEKIEQFSPGRWNQTIKELKDEICRNWRDKFPNPEQDLGKMIEDLEKKKIPDAEKKQSRAVRARAKKAKGSKTPKHQENIDKAQNEIDELNKLLTSISELVELTKLDDRCTEMKNCLKNKGYKGFFDLILNGKGKFKPFESEDFKKIVKCEKFIKLTEQLLPGEPDPDNMLMTVEIYSRKNEKDVLLSLIQKDTKSSGDFR